MCYHASVSEGTSLTWRLIDRLAIKGNRHSYQVSLSSMCECRPVASQWSRASVGLCVAVLLLIVTQTKTP